MKKTIIVGNIGRDAEVREVRGGHKFVTFSVAYDDREEKNEDGSVKKDDAGNPVKKAQWAECELYVKPEKSAEGLLKVLTKGRHIYVEAHDKSEAWTDKNGELQARILYKVDAFEV